MLIIDKLCSNLELADTGKVKTKVNCNQELNQFDLDKLLNDLEYQMN